MSFRGDRWSGITGGRRPPMGYSRGSSSSGRGGYPSRTGWRQKSGPPPRPPSPPLGPVLTTLSEKDLATSADLNEHPAKITDCEYIASYNWLNRGESVILVPGKPPAWTPLRTPEKLKEDSGKFFRDLNAARHPKHPSEPAVRAIFSEKSDFQAPSIDIFACGSTMGNLLRFVRKIDKPFRFLVEVVGNTVFFTRRENSPTELIPNVWGYGHTFPEAYTTWDADVKNSESHQRIIQYTFGGLKCLVRFEGDGYHRNLVPKAKPQHTQTFVKPAETSIDSLPTDFALSSLAQQKFSTTPGESLSIKPGGERIPQSSIFDLKTRSIRKIDQDILSDEIPRLWVAQIPNFVLAYHNSGVFTDVRTQDVRKEIIDWEAKNEEILQRLNALIREIIAFAKSKIDGKLEVRRAGAEVLELREQEGVFDVLPPEVKDRWIGRHEDSKEEQDEDPSLDHIHDDPDRHSDGGSVEDFTACSADDCGYCGHCSY